jgi:hypothetical protein
LNNAQFPPASPRIKESPRSPEKTTSKTSVKKFALERRNSKDTVASQLGGFKMLEVPQGQQSGITPVMLTRTQKKLEKKKKELTVEDLTPGQISAQQRELTRLGVLPLKLIAEDNASDPSPRISQSPRPAASPHRHGAKKPVPASTPRVLPDTPRVASPRSKTPRESRRLVPGRSEVSTATRVDPSKAHLEHLDRKLSIKCQEVDGLKRQYEAAKQGLGLLQQKRDQLAARTFHGARSEHARDEEGAKANAYEEIDEMIGNLRLEDEHRQQ